MDQCGDGQFGFGFEIGLELNDSLVVLFGFVFDRQTAESFTSAAASAATSAIFLVLDRNLNLQACNVVRKMFTSEGHDLLGGLPLQFQ